MKSTFWSRTIKVGHGWVFQHGNDPKHTGRATKEQLRKKHLKVVERPSRSSGLGSMGKLQKEQKLGVSQQQRTEPIPRVALHYLQTFTSLKKCTFYNVYIVFFYAF